MDYSTIVIWALQDAKPLHVLAAMLALSLVRSLSKMQKSIDKLNDTVTSLLIQQTAHKSDLEGIEKRVALLEEKN